ncbi:restriction endonuclease subunit S [Vibrio jasicida]|uniref:restriction endonuclease subunit S n=1 Tax=Vibrio jasicida TaxID=766224 RepID=UPI0005EDEA22|nr:restriction endonuclease subunit S [Vibrio jasicida]
MNKVELDSVATVSAGQSAPKKNEFDKTGIPFVRAGSLEALIAGKSEDELELVSEETIKKRKLKIYPQGSIVFAKSGMSATKDRIYVLKKPACVVSHLAILQPNENVNGEYLKFSLMQFPPSRLIKDPAYPSINLEQIKKYNIPVDSEIENQNRIALLLGKVEYLISQRKYHLKQVDELINSVFLHAFGDPALNDKGWKTDNFSSLIAQLRNGLSPSKSGEYDGLVYTLSAITGDSFREIYKADKFNKLSDVNYPSSEDFLVCRGNGNVNLVGKGYFYPGKREDIMFPDTMIGVTLKPDLINKLFLEHLWKSQFIRDQIEKKARTANGTYKINQSALNSIEIILPPKEIQIQFSFVVDKVNAIRVKYVESLENLVELYKSLSQKVFSGKLDVNAVPLLENSKIEEEQNKAVGNELPDLKQTQIKFECITKPLEQIERITKPIKYFGHISKALEKIEGITEPLKQVEQITRYLEAIKPSKGILDLIEKKTRQKWLMKLIKESLADLGPNISLSLPDFWEVAQDWISNFEQEDGDRLSFSMDDYEVLKNYVFSEVRNGSLVQEYEESSNSIKFKVNKK